MGGKKETRGPPAERKNDGGREERGGKRGEGREQTFFPIFLFFSSLFPRVRAEKKDL